MIIDNYSEIKQEPPVDSFPYSRYAIWTTILIMILYSVVQSAFYLFSNNFGDFNYLPIILGASQLLVILPATFFFNKFSPLANSEILRLEGNPSLRQFIIAFIGIVALLFFETGFRTIEDSIIPNQWMDYYDKLNNETYESYKNLLYIKGNFGFLLAITVGALIPAISEEILFRGYLQIHLEKKYSWKIAIIITGIFFGLIHLNIIQIVPLIIFGVYLAFIAYSTKSLIIPIICHFLNNLVAITALYYTPLAEIDKNSEDIPIYLAIIFVIAGLGVMALCGKMIRGK